MYRFCRSPCRHFLTLPRHCAATFRARRCRNMETLLQSCCRGPSSFTPPRRFGFQNPPSQKLAISCSSPRRHRTPFPFLADAFEMGTHEVTRRPPTFSISITALCHSSLCLLPQGLGYQLYACGTTHVDQCTRAHRPHPDQLLWRSPRQHRPGGPASAQNLVGAG